MPVKTIANVSAPGYGPLGFVNPAPLNDQVLIEAVNTSGGVLSHGDVVVIDKTATVVTATGWIPFPAVAAPPVSPQAAGMAVTTSTTAGDRLVLGVVSYGDASSGSLAIANGSACMVCISGVARVQIAAQVVVAGDLLGQSAVAKAAVGTTTAVAAGIGSFFGIALEATAAKDAQNTIRALLRSS